MAETKEKMDTLQGEKVVETKEKVDTLQEEKKAKVVPGCYESTDINVLRLALLSKHGFKLNSITNLVEPLKPTDPPKSPSLLNTYVLAARGASDSFEALEKDVATILLDPATTKQILIPYRMAHIEHWVTVCIKITAKDAVLTIYDSTGILYASQSFEGQLGEFFKKRSIVFQNLGKSNNLYAIQYDKEKNVVQNIYCGGYTTRLIISLALNPLQDISEKAVWQCSNNDDVSRKEDVDTVNNYNPTQSYSFGRKGTGEEYLKEEAHQISEAKEQKELQNILIIMGQRIKLLEEKLLKEISIKVIKDYIDLSDAVAIKKGLIELHGKNESMRPLLELFFAVDGKPIGENSKIITNVPVPTLWRGFVQLLLDKLIVSDPDLTIPTSLHAAKKSKYNSELTTPEAVWKEVLFGRFLSVKIISQRKACKIDCTFEEVDSISYKALLVSAKNELLKREIGDAIIVVRKIAGSFIFGKICLEKEPARLSLELFSVAFLNTQGSHNLSIQRTWDTRVKGNDKVKGIQYRKSFGKEGLNVFTSIMNVDFLRQKTAFGITRLRCYSIPEHSQYQETIALHTLCTGLGLEVEEIVDEKQKLEETKIRKIEQRYLSLAQYSIIRDAAVAKTQQGFSYQEYLTMLISYLAKEDSSASCFSLTAEAMIPEAWNDVVLEWDKQLIFFQQKHRSLYSPSVPESYTTAQILFQPPKKSKKTSKTEETEESSEFDETCESGAESKDNSEAENVKKPGKIKKSDASILKYYKAYRRLLKDIQDPHHPLHCHIDKIKAGNLKFIFFTNRTFPITIAKDGSYHLDGYESVKFKLVLKDQIPLQNLAGFVQALNEKSIWKLEGMDASLLGLPKDEQTALNEFLKNFFLFTKQKTADQLLEHCNNVIHSTMEGYGQSLLINVFEQYIHHWFKSENPENHVLDKAIIKHFFDNHELYHYNLVKYSSYSGVDKKIEQLLDKQLKEFKALSCFQKFSLKNVNSKEMPMVIACENPLVALACIQRLFPVNERQVLTPFSPELSEYKPSKSLKYAIVMGEWEELSGIYQKLQGLNIVIIQIKKTIKENDVPLDLNVPVQELKFLKEYDSKLALFKPDFTICVTELLLFIVTDLTNGLSKTEHARYVSQRLEMETVVLPYDKLKIALFKEIKENKEIEESSWSRVKVKGDYHIQCVVKIKTPKHLSQKTIQPPSSRNFRLEQDGTLYYIHKELEKDFPPVLYSEPLKIENKMIDFTTLESTIDTWIRVKDPFAKAPENLPGVRKIISLKYEGEAPDIVSSNKWKVFSKNKIIYYYPNGKPEIKEFDWESIYANKTVSIIEAEAACGKTWHLRSRINSIQMIAEKRIPIFIRIVDILKVRNFDNPTPELLNNTLLPEHICRMATQYPTYFHLFLDGYDELPKDFLEKFESILRNIMSKNYSVTVTVRDYQTKNLERYTSDIILKQRLAQFNDPEIKECFEKALAEKNRGKDKAEIKTEIDKLCEFLHGQDDLSGLLGIPFHVALLAEWYDKNRDKLNESAPPLIAEIYNFIIQNRIESYTNKTRNELYKILYRIAYQQILGKNEADLIISGKDHHFKQSLYKNLERTGLLRDPYSHAPELCHRTFAEFLVAKKLSKKLISQSCKNLNFNLKVIQILYRSENRLVCSFFVELFKRHSADDDIPYELQSKQQTLFEERWLKDVNGQSLTYSKTNNKLVAWQNTEEQPEPQNFLVLPNIDINLSIEFARQYMQYLKDKAYNLEIQSEYKQGFLEIIKSKQITLPELLKLLSDTNVKQNRYKVILKLLGLYIQINDNAAENIFNEILTVLTDLHNRLLAPPILFEQEILHWWRIDDIIAFIVFFSGKFTEPEKTNQFSILTWQVCNSFNVENRLLGASTLTIVNNLSLFPRPSINYKTKDRIARFVLFCLAIYHNTPVGTVRDNLKNFIREINIDFFLRHDFPQKKSFFELYKDIEEFNIELVQKAYQGLKAISKNYAWRTNNYAFQCWSEEGFKDTDFAMPVLSQIGPHLNIVHVFYITLYIQYGGYELRNKMRLADSAIDHIGEIEVKNNSDLRVLFCSEILFLSSINIWKQNREHPELAWTVVENFIDGCGLLIQSSEVNANVKLFTHIMLIELMTIFNFRGYTQFNADETQLKLTVISPSGHVKELMVTGSNMHFMSQENYQKICEELCAEEQRDLACMDRLMNVWDLFIRKLHEESLEEANDSSDAFTQSSFSALAMHIKRQPSLEELCPKSDEPIEAVKPVAVKRTHSGSKKS